jgi:hypothetical protein
VASDCGTTGSVLEAAQPIALALMAIVTCEVIDARTGARHDRGTQETTMNPSKTSTFLRRVIMADAALTGTTAILLVAAATPLDGLLGLPAALLRGAGLSLIPFTAFLVYLLRKPTLPREAGWFVIACNALWAIDSVVLLLTGWVDPTLVGRVFVVFQALVVAVIAEAQYVGLRSVARTT